MKHKIRRLFGEERGNIMVLFAGTLIVIIGFIGLSLDVGLLLLQRNDLQTLSQVIRQDRFTFQDTIRNADDPGSASFTLIDSTLKENGFDGTLKVYFYEEDPLPNYRSYRIRTVLSDDCPFYFARVFGLTTTTLSVSLDGGETIGDKGNDVVWHPKKSPSEYNGCYTSLPGGGYNLSHSDIPSDLKT
ncbi:Putative Flp pilus-assembly TadE/G-like [Sporobacter termitidis DSM 10068]|uniref:Putative Flp pilus-assembly TadE/G-like n=1 Tax=Sporobacter termitidis DSM 10068 TaxID=1123282 RepID=A0A1M5Z4V4_9FIRM|nr:pilus assembly protein TadG-related protein [Sporobacter termitidis]SHI18913.1 Putative Flp pilus-assembly TadE/G-like [Sporobacter termitidis DSM 10068]